MAKKIRFNRFYRGVKPKLTKRKLKALIKDERKATKEYKKLGLNNLSKDENKHRIYLSKKIARL